MGHVHELQHHYAGGEIRQDIGYANQEDVAIVETKDSRLNGENESEPFNWNLLSEHEKVKHTQEDEQSEAKDED